MVLIHGGGHCLFTRKDINKRQVEILLTAGIIPVSIDYRLCPEVNITEGPMTDVADAVQWARSLSSLTLVERPDLVLNGKVAVVGWSTGGTLAMSTAFNTLPRGIETPVAILAFYCPTDYESDCEY